MPKLIYTTGYWGKKPDDLKELVDRLDAMLIDIRFWPHSRWAKQWNRENLKLLLGSRYVWLKDLGNRNFNKSGAAMSIVDMEAGLNVVTAFRGPVILMCVCKKVERCHRSVIASELQSRGYQVKELETWSGAEI